MSDTTLPDDKKSSSETGAVIAWWSHLHGWRKEGETVVKKGPGDNGTRARLRRESTVRDILLDPSVQGLLTEVVARSKAQSGKELELDEVVRLGERIAVLAPLLAKVKPGQPTRQSFASVLGRTDDNKAPGPDDRPRLSRDRFAALVRALGDRRDPNRLLTALRRTVDKLGDVPFDVPALINDVYYARFSSGAENATRKWTFDYFQTPYANTSTQKETAA